MNYREKFCVWLFDLSTKPYAKWFKNESDAWNVSVSELLTYPTNTLGNAVGNFLHDHGFQFIPRLESHDAYHVITGYGTDVPNEIAQQFFFYGNGKRSLYMFGVLFLSVFVLPEHFDKYIAAYKRGLQSLPLHEIDLKNSLHVDLDQIRQYIFQCQYEIK